MSTMEVFESLTSELQVGQQARSVGMCEKRRAAGTATCTATDTVAAAVTYAA